MPLEHLLSELRNPNAQCSLAVWPGRLRYLDDAGLYAWWVDASGAEIISSSIGAPLSPGLIYVGQAGATTKNGRRSDATLRSRLGGNHIAGRIRNSTLRRTIAAILLDQLKGHIEGGRVISREGEKLVTNWMEAHLYLTVAPFLDRNRLRAFEDQTLLLLDPPLNLRGMSPSPLRIALSKRRSAFCSKKAMPHTQPSAAGPSVGRVASAASCQQRKAITLHEEIADILCEHGNIWMTTAQVAVQVNARGQYAKRDQSLITDFQIHGRTRKYDHLFQRDGSRVRLI